ncbi:MAG: S9 family peptidase [Flavobacteriales bacterium]|nr:S9 family peptidase [Flavobacteriales bacterium]
MNQELLAPPIAAKKDCVLTSHGHQRIDPYFWMRLTDEQKTAANPDEQTQEVLEYLNNENAFTRSVLKHTESLQDTLYDEMVARLKKDDESVPYLHNGYYYYARYREGGEYPIYCRKKENLEAKEEVMLDVNQMAEGHAYYAAVGLEVSPDNRILAFGEDTLSRRIYTLRFLDLTTGQWLPDRVENTTGGGAWASDNKTYFYTTKNPVSLLSEKIWSHFLGEKEDRLRYHEKDPSYYIDVRQSKSGAYIFIEASSTTTDHHLILDASHPDEEFRSFTEIKAGLKYDIEHAGDRFFVLTNLDALNFRVMECPTHKTSIANWKEIVAHRPDVLVQHIDVFENHLVLSERSHALTHLRIMNLSLHEEHTISFDEDVYVVYSNANYEYHSKNLRFTYASLTTPATVYDYDMITKERVLRKQQEVVGGHDPDMYVSKRLMATAADGTSIPISLVYKKDTPIGKDTPLLLYAYGSYGHSIDPGFSPDRLSLLNRGFVYAIAHIRGGQEMGRSWYENGKMFQKKNTFTDFIDCAKYLSREGYTSPGHLYAMGGSAGGLLMGAIVNMAPETFHGVVAMVPFVDVVSTMLDESIPLTTNEFDEWGNPKNKDSYDYMLSYSPYDNVKAMDYPNILVTTGLFDSQVQYWEPAKWVAKLRAMKTDHNLLLLDTNMESGHGGASGRYKRYHETALIYAFLLDLEKNSAQKADS